MGVCRQHREPGYSSLSLSDFKFCSIKGFIRTTVNSSLPQYTYRSWCTGLYSWGNFPWRADTITPITVNYIGFKVLKELLDILGITLLLFVFLQGIFNKKIPLSHLYGQIIARACSHVILAWKHGQIATFAQRQPNSLTSTSKAKAYFFVFFLLAKS